jgi:hypothetical protein
MIDVIRDGCPSGSKDISKFHPYYLCSCSCSWPQMIRLDDAVMIVLVRSSLQTSTTTSTLRLLPHGSPHAPTYYSIRAFHKDLCSSDSTRMKLPEMPWLPEGLSSLKILYSCPKLSPASWRHDSWKAYHLLKCGHPTDLEIIPSDDRITMPHHPCIEPTETSEIYVSGKRRNLQKVRVASIVYEWRCSALHGSVVISWINFGLVQ